MEVSALPHPSSIPGLRGPSALLRLQSDERLITLTRRGQHAAFEVLCARYQSRLLAFCRHMLASREDAEDVLQEVFAAAFNAVLADERDINVRPWLYRIARNRSLNHLRRTSAIGVDSMDVHFADGGVSTSDKVIRRESFRELITDVHQLPETQRTALLLREIDALSYEQIAHAMETTVPSVKSLLVRARISLAEASEARKLSCDEVRLELGSVAEGLTKLSTPARRHLRTCERCTFFKKQLHENNRALALIMPVGPLLLLKKLLLVKLGSTASAGGAHVAGGAGATVGASATAGAAGAGAGAGAAVTGGSLASGLVTAGAGALATKAVAGLAAAAIVTAGAVAADHAVTHRHPRVPSATSASVAQHYASEPVVVHRALQPISAGGTPTHRRSAAGHRAHPNRIIKKTNATPAPPTTSATPGTAVATTPDTSTTTATKPVGPQATAPIRTSASAAADRRIHHARRTRPRRARQQRRGRSSSRPRPRALAGDRDPRIG
jgi:RNA polymerase sigma factor (sigma-70 family)